MSEQEGRPSPEFNFLDAIGSIQAPRAGELLKESYKQIQNLPDQTSPEVQKLYEILKNKILSVAGNEDIFADGGEFLRKISLATMALERRDKAAFKQLIINL